MGVGMTRLIGGKHDGEEGRKGGKEGGKEDTYQQALHVCCGQLG